MENAIKYVEANIGRCDLSVEELSRGLGMSRVHLYKKLLQITGKTPIEFIRVIRLKRAAQMLRESQQNVSEIAYQWALTTPSISANISRMNSVFCPLFIRKERANNKMIPFMETYCFLGESKALLFQLSGGSFLGEIFLFLTIQMKIHFKNK